MEKLQRYRQRTCGNPASTPGTTPRRPNKRHKTPRKKAALRCLAASRMLCYNDKKPYFKQGDGRMRILGIDYGDARTGLSVSDQTGLLAGSPSVIEEWNHARLLERLAKYIKEERIEEIVLGYPKNMHGRGARAEMRSLCAGAGRADRPPGYALGRAPHNSCSPCHPARER